MKLFQDSPLDLIPENSIVRLSSFSSSSSSFSSIPVYRYIAFLRASFNEGQLLSVLTSLEKLAGSRRPKGERSVAQSEGSHGGGNRRGFVLKFRERKSSSGQTPGAKSGTERAGRTKEKGSFVRCANARVSDEIVNKKKRLERSSAQFIHRRPEDHLALDQASLPLLPLFKAIQRQNKHTLPSLRAYIDRILEHGVPSREHEG